MTLVGDVLEIGDNKQKKLMVVVHWSESSCKVIEVSREQVANQNYIFDETNRGENWSAMTRVWPRDADGDPFISLYTTLPASRLKLRPSTYEERRSGIVGISIVPIPGTAPKKLKGKKQDEVLKSVIHDEDYPGHLEMLQSGARIFMGIIHSIRLIDSARARDSQHNPLHGSVQTSESDTPAG